MGRRRSLAHRQVMTITLTATLALLVSFAALWITLVVLAALLAPTPAEVREASLRFGRALATGRAEPAPERNRLAPTFTFSIREADGPVLVEVAEADLVGADLTSPAWRRLAELVDSERASPEVAYSSVSDALLVPTVVVAGLQVVAAVAWAGRRTAVVWTRSLDDLTAQLRAAGSGPAPGGADPSEGWDAGTPRPRYAELTVASETLHALLAQLRQERTRQHEYVSDVIHELRSPITAMRTHAEAALMFPERVAAATALTIVVREAGRLEELVTQLQVVARSRPRQSLTALALPDLVTAVRTRTADSRVELGPLAPVRVLGDQALLQAALGNLVANAQRFARARIRIVVQRDGDRARVCVDDDGPGIPADQREAVFQRRVHHGLGNVDHGHDDGHGDDGQDHDGLGLGLPIVRAIAELHDGTVLATSSPFGGARLELTLPVAGGR